MGTLEKLTIMVPEEFRELAGKSDIEWTIDGEKVNCGTAIAIVKDGKNTRANLMIMALI